MKNKFTRSYVRNVRIDFPTLFVNWYKIRVRFIFRTCFGLAISVRARGHCQSSRRSARRYPGVEGAPFMQPPIASTLFTQPPIASTPGSSPLERPGPDNITSQPWSDVTCPCNTASTTLSCLAYFNKKSVTKQK